MVEKRTKGRTCHSINRYAKANNKYLKMMMKRSSYSKYWDVNNLYGRTMSQKLPINGFKWVEDLSEFDEGFIKSHNEISKERYLLEVDADYYKKKNELHNDLPFLLEKNEY